MKDIVCKHCQAVNKHHSFQCALIRKPIKKKDLTPDQLAASKRVVKQNPKVTKAMQNKVNRAAKNISQPKTIRALLRLAELVFNKWVRNRDAEYDRTFKCISCHAYYPISEMDAGHFISKNSSAVRFNEMNVNGQCRVNCNNLLHGNPEPYRKELIWRHGIEKVRELELLAKKPHKWDKQELLDLIEKYKL